MIKRQIILFLLLTSSFVIFGQTTFWKQWQSATPIFTNPSLSSAEKLDTCLAFLKISQANHDTINEICGYGLLFHAYLDSRDYANANLNLKQAEALIQQSQNPAQMGWVRHKQAVLAIRLIDFEKAKMYCLSSIEYCHEGKDSICLALSHEQAGSIYGGLNDFDSAAVHFERAQKLLLKFANETHLAAFNNNYANMHSLSGHPEKAIPYLNRAIEYYRKSGQIKIQAKAMNNLARAHLNLENYSLARQLYEQCVQINKEYNIADNLISNYHGLFDLSYQTDNMKEAFQYLDAYYELKDSLVGAQTQREIAALELNFTNQKLELELAKREVTMHAVERTLERRNTILLIGSIVLIALLGIFLWRAKISRERMARNQEHLTSLTKIILEKNKKLIDVQERMHIQKAERNKSSDAGVEINLFDMRILTDSDWTVFQSSFEKVHPRYIQGLRHTFPSISESEERLFLFIKLNLNKKESATILGITADSVKKTRNRLRKRLQLSAEQNLDDYVHNFKPSSMRISQYHS